MIYKVNHADWLHFDRNPTLTLNIHLIQKLVVHLARRNSASEFKQPIGKCGLAVINVRDNTKISNM